MKLEKKETIEIVPISPFHFDSTFYKPGHFPSSDTKWESGKRWQTMLWRRERLGLIYQNAGSDKKTKIKVSVYSNKVFNSDFLESLKKEIIWRFNLDLNLAEFYKDVGNDPLLSP